MFSEHKVMLVPDIVLFSEYVRTKERGNIATLVLRSDVEQVVNDHDQRFIIQTLREKGLTCRMNDTQKSHHVRKEAREQEVNDFLSYLEESRIMVTDRLHGMIFAVITGTPCIAFSNCNQKVRWSYEWIEHLDYIKFLDTIEGFEQAVEELLAVDVKKYQRSDLKSHYDHLAAMIKASM